MLEVEVKFAVENEDALRAALAGWQPLSLRREQDTYFAAPDRSFVFTDEVLRIRSAGDKNWITYKGPKRDIQTKTRTELELPLVDGAEARDRYCGLLEHLGYQPVGTVKKSRQPFEITRDGFTVQATIDDVDQVGRYAEVEIVSDEAHYSRARDLVLAITKELGLTRLERRSYIGLLLEKTQSRPAIEIASSVHDLRRLVASAHHRNLSVGFVPTMGALHAGHTTLIDQARKECGFVVVSIFVNPTQFGPNEDFNKYPRTLDADLKLCQEHGVDLVFSPKPNEVYPDGFQTHVEVAGLSDVFEGAIRPGHLRGVATVVLKLFNMVQPDVAYFGQKDAQQACVIQQMVRDLDVRVRLVIVPTVREEDGLALSSRNRYLDPTMRKQAVVLSQALLAARSAFAAGERDGAKLAQLMTEAVAKMPDVKLDYAAIVDAERFTPLAQISDRALAIIAARLGGTRLIDNQLLAASKSSIN